MISEKMNEYRQPLWVVEVDFQKAFDSVSHTSSWQALQEQQVPYLYIQVLSPKQKNTMGNFVKTRIFIANTTKPQREEQFYRGPL